MYLIPPMDDEPPPEYVAFVTLHADDLRAEASRLVGGDAGAAERIYLRALTETAGHWRRLRWWSRLTHRNTMRPYIQKFMDKSTEQWREDQIYEIRVIPLRDEPQQPRTWSMAMRKAAFIGSTARTSLDALADAEIAWQHAWRRSQRRHVVRAVGGAVLLVGGMIQFFSSLSSGGY
jgi:hypothetical protein